MSDCGDRGGGDSDGRECESFSERGVDVQRSFRENISRADFATRREMIARDMKTNNQREHDLIERNRRFSSGAVPGTNLDRASSDSNDSNAAKSRRFFSTDDLSRSRKRNKKKSSSTTKSWRDDNFYADIFRAVNRYRRKHNAKALKTNHRMNAYARDYAKKLSKGLPASSRLGKKYGVNMFQKKLFDGNAKIAGGEVADEWYSEVTDFIFAENTEDLMQKGSNFSQMVWKNSSEIGLGVGWSEDKSTVYVVGLFRPQGNIKGQYSKEVSPLRQRSKEGNESSSDDEEEDRKRTINKKKKSGKISQFLSRIFKSSKGNQKDDKHHKDIILVPGNASDMKDIDFSSTSSGDTKSTLQLQDITKKGDPSTSTMEEGKDNASSPKNLLKYVSVDESARYSNIVYPLDREKSIVEEATVKNSTATNVDSPSNFLDKTGTYFGIEHSISIESNHPSPAKKDMLTPETPLSNLSRQSSSSSSSSSSSGNSHLSITKHEYLRSDETITKIINNATTAKVTTESSKLSPSKSSQDNIQDKKVRRSSITYDYVITLPEVKTDNEIGREQILSANKEFLKGEIAANDQDGVISLGKITSLEDNKQSNFDNGSYNVIDSPSFVRNFNELSSYRRLSSSSSSNSDDDQKITQFQIKKGTGEKILEKYINDDAKKISESSDSDSSDSGNNNQDNKYYEVKEKLLVPVEFISDVVTDKEKLKLSPEQSRPEVQEVLGEIHANTIKPRTDTLATEHPGRSEVISKIDLKKKISSSSDSSHTSSEHKPIAEIIAVRRSSSSSEGEARILKSYLPRDAPLRNSSTFGSDEQFHSFVVTKVNERNLPTDNRSRSSSSSSSSSNTSNAKSAISTRSSLEVYRDELETTLQETKECSQFDKIISSYVNPQAFLSKSIDSDSNSSEERTRTLVEKYFPPVNEPKSRKSSTSSSDSEEKQIEIPLVALRLSTRKLSSSSDEAAALGLISREIDKRKYTLSGSSTDSDSEREEKINHIKKTVVDKVEQYKVSISERCLFSVEKFPANILKEVNYYREMHGVTPLNLDYYLCCLARKRAAQMILPDDVQKTLYNYGELSYQTDDTKITEKEIASSWYKTGDSYQFGNVPEKSHWPFTQMIWKDTLELGAGGLFVEEENKYILVVLCNPEGNIQEEWTTQINPKK